MMEQENTFLVPHYVPEKSVSGDVFEMMFESVLEPPEETTQIACPMTTQRIGRKVPWHRIRHGIAGNLLESL